MEIFQLSRGQIMFRETWHYKNLVSSPRTGDYAYQARSVWDMAKKRGTSWSYVNADSYALDAVAIYVQQYYKSSMSPVPWRELSELDADAEAATSQPPDENAKAVTFTDKPPGWVGPISNTNTPDMSVWEEVHDNGLTSSLQPFASATPPSTDAKFTCTGDTTTKWMNRDALNSPIGIFCGDAETQGVQNPGSASLVRKYNKGWPDAVLILIDWLSEFNFKLGRADCVGYMTKIMDSCNGNDPKNNPINWKHGSYNQVGDKRHNISPMTKRYKSDVCTAHVQGKEDFWGPWWPGYRAPSLITSRY